MAQAEATVHFNYVRSIDIHASFIIRVVLESLSANFLIYEIVHLNLTVFFSSIKVILNLNLSNVLCCNSIPQRLLCWQHLHLQHVNLFVFGGCLMEWSGGFLSDMPHSFQPQLHDNK